MPHYPATLLAAIVNVLPKMLNMQDVAIGYTQTPDVRSISQRPRTWCQCQSSEPVVAHLRHEPTLGRTFCSTRHPKMDPTRPGGLQNSRSKAKLAECTLTKRPQLPSFCSERQDSSIVRRMIPHLSLHLTYFLCTLA